MLEVRNLTKVYKPKRGIPVAAVDHVSLKFPEKGMVFLLGKSGSGKSTMLNLLGGLDKYDEGEIIIKDVSSASFKQRHFDSYRNTYLGFIFQEYNILEEFNVGANIALALELQGVKASDEVINTILAQVDLAGYGNRKPNELSGGQKQRVAIARALVKNPEIIMADEPTGALDSATGRQVLDTLKKLSAEKLVIVVSHDREFAEKYADRIIELADGRVISDIEYFGEDSDEKSLAESLSFTDSEVVIAADYHLTEDDRLAINNWLDQRKGGKLSVGGKKQAGTRTARQTDESTIFYSFANPFKLIKSKLPMKNAFKIGANSLGHKKFRLVMTVLLSCIAFGLFGLADTFGCYDNVNAGARSIIDSDISYATFSKSIEEKVGDYVYYENYGNRLSNDDISYIEKKTGLSLIKSFCPDTDSLMFDAHYDTAKSFTDTEYHIYAPNFSGFAEVDEDILKAMNADIVAGRLPEGGKREIAITSYVVETFKIGGYRMSADKTKFSEINGPEDMVGKTIILMGKEYTITGVVDTHFDLGRYKKLTVESKTDTSADTIIDYALYSELSYAKNYSLMQKALVGKGFVESQVASSLCTFQDRNGNISLNVEDENSNFYFDICANYFGEYNANKDKIVLFENGKNGLSDNEVVLGESFLRGIWSEMAENETFMNITYEEFLKNLPTLSGAVYSYSNANGVSYTDYKIAGYIPSENAFRTEVIIVNEKNAKIINNNYENYTDCYYDMAIGAMPSTYSGVKKIVKFSEEVNDSVRYQLNNAVTFELDGLNEAFLVLSKVFFWIGVGFAVFASIMLANFIASSIAYKKQEIGILRAIGARGSDVFRIFFSESFIIAMINFVLSALGTGIVTAIINFLIRKNVGILVTVLSFGIRQIALLFVISVGIAAFASFFPVWKIAKKRPIDAIRNR